MKKPEEQPKKKPVSLDVTDLPKFDVPTEKQQEEHPQGRDRFDEILKRAAKSTNNSKNSK